MPRNLFTFNFEWRKALEFLRKYRALLLGLSLFMLAQCFFLYYADVSQVGSKQVVKEKRIWAKEEGFIQRKKGAESVFFMGNSHIASGIIPNVFDEENDGKTYSYNLSLVGLQIPSHYFMMKDYLKRHDPPEYVLIDPTPGGFEIESFPSYAIQGASLFEVAQYAYYRKHIDVLLNYLFPSRLHWPEVTRYFLGKLIKSGPQYIKRKHQEIYLNRFAGEPVYGHNRKYFYESQYVDPDGSMKESLGLLRQNRGYYFIVEQSSEESSLTQEDLQKHFPTQFAKYLERKENQVFSPIDCASKMTIMKKNKQEKVPVFFDAFFGLMKRHNIKVVLIPAYVLDIFQGEDCMPDFWRMAMEKYDNVFTLENMTGSQKYSFEYFSDPGHLNRRGAIQYTKHIAEKFRLFREGLESCNE